MSAGRAPGTASASKRIGGIRLYGKSSRSRFGSARSSTPHSMHMLICIANLLTGTIVSRTLSERDRDPGRVLLECRRGLRTARRQAGDALRLREPGRPPELPPGHQAGTALSPRRAGTRTPPSAQPQLLSPPPGGRLDGRPLGRHHVRRAADAARLLALTALALPRR